MYIILKQINKLLFRAGIFYKNPFLKIEKELLTRTMAVIVSSYNNTMVENTKNIGNNNILVFTYYEQCALTSDELYDKLNTIVSLNLCIFNICILITISLL